MHFLLSSRQRSWLAIAFCALFLTVRFCFAAPAFAADDLSILADQSDTPGDVEALLEELSFLQDRKIAVNVAAIDDLLVLPFLSPADAQRIVDYRRTKGRIGGKADLAEIVGDDVAEQIAPFLDFSLLKKSFPGDPVAVEGKWRTRWFQEIPPRKGIGTGAYAGDNYKLYNRVQLSYGDIFISALQEKDTGEPDFDDFTSLSFNLTGRGLLRQLVVGNYTATTGQGLLLGQSRYLSKGVQPLDVSLRKGALKPYTSSSESGFMQGAGMVLGYGPIEMMLFYSDNLVDASIDDGMITTLRTSGYHRTLSELEHRDNISEQVAGFNLRYLIEEGPVSGSAGATVISYRYDLPFEDAGAHDGWYDAASLDFNLMAGSVNFFGEAAVTGRERYLSWIAGAAIPLTATIESVIAVRDYHSRYFSPFAGAFAERADDGANEEGYYVGIEARLLKNLRVGAYYDIFRFPELSSYYGLPSTGDEAKIFLTWKQSPSVTLDLLLQNQYKEKAKKLEDLSGLEYYTLVPLNANRVRLDLITRLSRSLTMKTRGEVKFVEGTYSDETDHSKGWLLYEQAAWRKGPLKLTARYSRFHTENFDSAIYVYENDLPLVFNLKSYYGRGEAFFALLSMELMKNFDLSARYEKAWYANRDVYSSGNDLRLTSSPSSWHVGCALRF